MWLRGDSAETVRDGWESACLRYRHLREGGQLAPLPPSTLRLASGEVGLVDMAVGHAQFFAHDPADVMTAAGDAMHTMRGRWRADELMTPRWRAHADVRGVLTSERLLLDLGSWCVLQHAHLLEIVGDAVELEFVLRYDGHPDLMLYGSTAPFFAIALAWLTYGERGLALPAFGPIAAEVDGRPATEPANPSDPRFL